MEYLGAGGHSVVNYLGAGGSVVNFKCWQRNHYSCYKFKLISQLLRGKH